MCFSSMGELCHSKLCLSHPWMCSIRHGKHTTRRARGQASDCGKNRQRERERESKRVTEEKREKERERERERKTEEKREKERERES